MKTRIFRLWSAISRPTLQIDASVWVRRRDEFITGGANKYLNCRNNNGVCPVASSLPDRVLQLAK